MACSGVTQFDKWSEWTKNHQYNRSGMIGVGAFLNSIEGTLHQTRRALSPSTAGNSGLGAIFFSMATSNVAVTANPHSIPSGQDTSAPKLGHVMGFAKRSDGMPLDTATVTLENLDIPITYTRATDGGGFYGGVDLTPGQYLVRGELGGETLHSCVVIVTAGTVVNADLQPEISAPMTSASISPAAPNGSNGWYTSNVTVTLSAADDCSGVAGTEFSTDGGVTWQSYSSSIVISAEGITTINYRSIDRAGNIEETQSLTIKIDKAAPTISLSANPSTIWPPNGKIAKVTINGEGTESISGLDRVSYVVTDEYGSPLNISRRPPQDQSPHRANIIQTIAFGPAHLPVRVLRIRDPALYYSISAPEARWTLAGRGAKRNNR